MNTPLRPYLYLSKNATINYPRNDVVLFIANIGRISAIVKGIFIFQKDVITENISADVFYNSKICKFIKQNFIIWPEKKYVPIFIPDFGSHNNIIGRIEFEDVFGNIGWQIFRYDKISPNQWEIRGGLTWNDVINPNKNYEDDEP